MTVHRARSSAALVLLLLLAVPGTAAAAEDPYVPPALAPWVPWVLHGHDDLGCARVGDAITCGWPGELSLAVDGTGGSFALTVWADAETLVGLPGGGPHWPQAVKLGEVDAVVHKLPDGAPAVRVPAGAHVLTGRLPWPEPPEVLRLPPDVAVVGLTSMGTKVDRPRRDDLGRLWIQETTDAREQDEDDTLRVSVYRRLVDGVPLGVTTLLELNVSGRAREVSLGSVLLAGSRPVTLASELPVRVRAGGEVVVYVRPGSHTIELRALVPRPVETLTVPAAGEGFDPQEVWVWHPDDALRAVTLSGLTGVDPGRTSLPAHWHGATTFLAEPGQALAFDTARRGEPAPGPNQLHLTRTLWLDLDGRGYTVRDRLTGSLRQGWRLEHEGPGELGRVRKVAAQDDLLITAGLDSGRAGVELRDAAVDLEAELRIEDARDAVPAVGWAHDVQSLSARLQLPPGWSLLHAGGVDQVDGTWVDSWTLFELFILLLVALSMGKLFGWPWALVAGVAVALAHNEPDAPRLVWFSLLGAVALLRVLPKEGWFRRIAGGWLAVSVVSLVVILFPYARMELRYAMHPQVEDQLVSYGDADFGMFEPEMAQEKTALDVIDMPSSRSISKDEGKSKKAIQKRQVLQLQQIDPNAVVQTGPGVPTWSWQTWHLGWSGPVFQQHELDLWLLSPGWNRALSVLRVLFFVLMALVFLAPNRLTRRPPGFDPMQSLRRLAGVGSAAAIALTTLAAPPAHAQPVPDATTLEALRARLLAANDCEGQPCVVVPTLALALDDRTVRGTAEVHVGRRASGWHLPGPIAALRLDGVEVDGLPTTRLRREASGLVAVRLDPGRHVVTFRGTLPGQGVVTLQLDPVTRAERVTVTGDDWAVDGLDRFGVPQASLQLSRRAQEAPSGEAPADPGAGDTELPPWYDVERHLSLGMPWQTRTTVARGDADRPQLVKIPLLPGESVITEGVEVEAGHALVHLPRGTQRAEYLSELAIAETVTLAAPTDVPWSETWHVACSRIWRCSSDGLVPIRTVDGAGTFEPTWRPWPGETVEVAVGRPAGTPGAATTVTQVTYAVTPGKRLLEAQLDFTARASQSNFQRVTLPKGAQVQAIHVDGQPRTLQPEGRVLAVPLRPGEQRVDIRWQQPWERGVFESIPPVDLGSPAANATVRLDVGDDRWMLWTTGPDWGPAVLFWSHLAILLLLALVLGRLKALPVKSYQWFLLAIGLSQLPVIAMLVIVGWMGMLVRRRRAPFEGWAAFDAYQGALIVATLIALGVLYSAVHTNLLFHIDMQVEGGGSNNHQLYWYVDRIDGALPGAGMLSLPLLVWRGAMLLWALWLVRMLIKWLPWAWESFSFGDVIWRRMPRTTKLPPPEPPAPPAPAAETASGA